VPSVKFSLKGHTDRVNGVQWINHRILASVSSDKSVIIWSFENEDPLNPLNWTMQRVFTDAHEGVINYLRSYTINDELYLTTMCSSGTMKLWQGTTFENFGYKDQLLFGKNL
jgi:WD40 repeat protein